MKADEARDEIVKEFHEAIGNNLPFHSTHEGYSVILEEVEELWEEIMKKSSLRNIALLRKEAKQIAAMAMRFMVDLT